MTEFGQQQMQADAQSQDGGRRRRRTGRKGRKGTRRGRRASMGQGQSQGQSQHRSGFNVALLQKPQQQHPGNPHKQKAQAVVAQARHLGEKLWKQKRPGSYDPPRGGRDWA